MCIAFFAMRTWQLHGNLSNYSESFALPQSNIVLNIEKNTRREKISIAKLFGIETNILQTALHLWNHDKKNFHRLKQTLKLSYTFFLSKQLLHSL